MPRAAYQADLDTLREDVLYLSEIVIDRLRLALTALEQKDESLANTVIDGDDEINDLYLDLEADCVDLLALQQPVASDLRFITASFKLLTDLERIGDLATNLAAHSLTADRDRFPEVDVQAYAEADTDRCYALADRDDAVDRRCAAASETVVRDLLDRDDAIDADRLLGDVSRLLLTIRDLERIGDHAVNIASRTCYMVDNDAELLY